VIFGLKTNHLATLNRKETIVGNVIAAFMSSDVENVWKVRKRVLSRK
jgi:hypothetical protein